MRITEVIGPDARRGDQTRQPPPPHHPPPPGVVVERGQRGGDTSGRHAPQPALGAVHHGATRWMIEHYDTYFGKDHAWAMPVVAETYDGLLNDINALHVTPDHAIEALKAAGVKPGDLKIVSVDGTRGGFQAMVDGWFQADVECNPLLGPQLMQLAKDVVAGKAVPKRVTVEEGVYTADQAAKELPNRKY